MTVLTLKQKEEKVIELLNKGISIRDIAKEVKMSFSDIGGIKRKLNGEDTVQKKRPSINSQAFQLFLENKTMVDVAIMLNLSTNDVIKIHSEFLLLQNRAKMAAILDENKENVNALLRIHNYIISNKMNIKQLCDKISAEKENDKLKEEIENIRYEKDKLFESVKYWQQEFYKTNRKYKDLLQSKKLALNNMY